MRPPGAEAWGPIRRRVRREGERLRDWPGGAGRSARCPHPLVLPEPGRVRDAARSAWLPRDAGVSLRSSDAARGSTRHGGLARNVRRLPAGRGSGGRAKRGSHPDRRKTAAHVVPGWRLVRRLRPAAHRCMHLTVRELMSYTAEERGRWERWFRENGDEMLATPIAGPLETTIGQLVMHIFGPEVSSARRLRKEPLTGYRSLPSASV